MKKKNQIVKKENDSSSKVALTDIFEIENQPKPVQIFDMTVWTEKESEYDNVVLLGYIEKLYKEKVPPEEIAKKVGLPVSVVRRKLNIIANSFLGKIDIDVKANKRLEVDAQIARQLNMLNFKYEQMFEPFATFDLDLADKLQNQIAKLTQMRIKLWNLDAKEEVVSSKPSKVNNTANILIQNTTSEARENTYNDLADFIINKHNQG